MPTSEIAKGAIVGTLGPASDTAEILRGMIDAGLDVIRLNLSHGSHDDCKKRFDLVRDVDDTIPILLDLSGPKIRIGSLEKSVRLRKGEQFTLLKNVVEGDETQASILYPDLIDEANVGNILFLNDGLIELEIVEKQPDRLICNIIAGGPLSSRKGVNAPNVPINLYAPTSKDIRDIDFTINLDPEFYSVSFVRRKADLLKVRNQISLFTEERIPLISKIEHLDSLINIDEIIKETDGIMVARGDLGVELPLEDIPQVQRDLVEKCNYHSKTCIVATQMLESMVSSPRPTRAEVSDVTLAISQGSDAVMLSAETATGEYPVESVGVMNRIILKAQSDVKQKSSMKFDRQSSVAESIGRAAVSIASGLHVDKIMAFTRSGTTSAMISRFKPESEIISITPDKKTARRAKIQWGVKPLLLEKDYHNTDKMIFDGINLAFETGMIERKDTLVIVAGSMIGLPYSTNLVKYLLTDDIISSEEAKNRFIQDYNLDSE